MRIRRVITILALALPFLESANARAGNPHLTCASGVRANGWTATLVHLMLFVPDGAEADTIAREALAQEGAGPVASSGPSPFFVLSGHRWPQFFNGSRNDDLVTDLYNPDGQNFAGRADDAVVAAGQTWSDVPTATFALGLGGETATGSGFDRLNIITWPAVWQHSSSALAVTTTTFERTTGFILDADVDFNRSSPFLLNPQPGDGTFDFQRVILHEDGHVAGLDHSLDPNAVMFADLGPGPQSHSLAQDDVDAISTLYPLSVRPFRIAPPVASGPSPVKR